jgi:hypothetical protein
VTDSLLVHILLPLDFDSAYEGFMKLLTLKGRFFLHSLLDQKSKSTSVCIHAFLCVVESRSSRKSSIVFQSVPMSARI